MSDISLSLNTRQNLLSLQTTTSLLNRTSTRLSTGLKVNTPLDDAPAFFAAQALNFRAANFTTAQNNTEQAVRSLDGAINGIQAITKLVQNAQGVMNSLKTATSLSASETLRAQYNQLLSQIDKLSNDASYQGVNLLNNATQSLTLSFSNTPGVVDLSVSAQRSDSAGLFLSTIASGLFYQVQTTVPSQSSRASIASTASVASQASRESVVEVAALLSQASAASAASVASSPSQPSIASNATNQFSVPSQQSVPSLASIQSVPSRESQAAVQRSVSVPSQPSVTSVPSIGSIPSQPSSGGATIAAINLTLISATELAIGQALSQLTANAATLGSTNAILAVRIQFTQSYVTNLQSGAAQLTVADLNLEGANLTSLQTAQQLGVVSLQISTQSQQSILRLF
jgi:flagellin-like hook-associated protein FlgL